MTVKADYKLVGEAVHGTEKIPVNLKKVTAAAAITPEAPTATAGRGTVDLNGQWEALRMRMVSPFPLFADAED